MNKVLASILVTIALCHTCFAGEPMVHVFRWYIPQDKTYTVVTDRKYKDDELISRGWTGKTYLFDAYTTPGEGRVAVHGWVNAANKQQVSINDGEFTDEQMYKKGFTGKQLQFYVTVK